ncbi:MAG TPA: diguanylate cyclase [Anaerolineaceae bacterium]|nr:diguanylate cyclase [Anaerolineaceae bacterium]
MADPVVASDEGQLPPGEIQRKVDLINQQASLMIDEDVPRAVALCEEAIQLSTDHDPAATYRSGWARALHTLGRINSLQGMYGSALTCFMKSLALYEEIRSLPDVVNLLSYIGVTYCYVSDYPHGFEYLFRALKEAQALGLEESEAQILNDIGFAYVTLNQHNESLPYLEKSLRILQKNGVESQLSWTLDSLCHAHLGLGNYDQALVYGLESVRISKETGAWKKYAEHSHSVGQVYAARGDREKARQNFLRSLEVARKHGFPLEAANALRRLGEMHHQDGELNSALDSLQEALVLAEAIDARRTQIDCCRLLVDVYRDLTEFEKALDYHQRYHEIWVDVFNTEADRRVKNLQVMHQLDSARKETEIAHLKNLALLNEVEERKRAQVQLEHLANTDSLTGLVNRRYFYELAGAAFEQARSTRTSLAVLMVDIDHFKQVNDTYGHLTGDQVLESLAAVIRGGFRKDDITARFGGEEFVIVLPGSDAPTARQAAERLRKRVMQTPIHTDHGILALTISVGIALVTDEPDLNFETLLTRADRAMYRAKQAGRNRVRSHVES